MPDPNQILFTFWGMSLSASGAVALIVSVAVSLLIVAVAWRLVRT